MISGDSLNNAEFTFMAKSTSLKTTLFIEGVNYHVSCGASYAVVFKELCIDFSGV